MITLLLRASANVDLPTTDGLRQSPLHLAATALTSAGVRLLLLASANPMATNASGKAPIDVAPVESRAWLELSHAVSMWAAGAGGRTQRACLAQAAALGQVT